jgi:serine/threonine protein kinase
VNHAASESAKSSVNLTGQRLMDRYVVREKIARGGMGVLFRGEDERLQRQVCVKVFQALDPSRPEYATILEHFVQEAFTLSRLQHPNTLRIYDFGWLDEAARRDPYFVTEYADAGNLATLIEGAGPLPAADVLRILEPIVGALREAHDAGVVHRDIKPSNILFTYAGGGPVPKLADFSIAKALKDMPNRAQDTNAQVPLYSLSWAAPEQIGDGVVGVQADVFALGLMSAFMLTGTLVYPGIDIIALYAMRSEGAEFRRRAIEALELPASVEAVILAACAEDVEDRHPSVEAFFEAFEEALEAEMQAAKAPPAPEPAPVPFPITWGDDLARDDDDDDELLQTRRHPAYDFSQIAGPSEPVAPAAPMAPAVSTAVMPAATGATPPHKPRLQIASLAAPVVVVGNRRVRLVESSDTPLAVGEPIAGVPARVRVTPNDVGGARVHIKGLNCFLRPAGGRPSSGQDIFRTTTLDLLAPTMAVRAQVHVLIGTIVDGTHVFELGEAILAVPTALAAWVVVLELGSGRDALLLYRT